MTSRSLAPDGSTDVHIPMLAEPLTLPLPRREAPVVRQRDLAATVEFIEDRRRIGLIHNAQARHNRRRAAPEAVRGVEHATPRSYEELRDVLAGFAADRVDAIIIDGGDGTVRDVASAIARYHPDFAPRVAIVPSGKTNALALDLGIAAGWSVADAVQAIRAGRTRDRSPIEVWRAGAEQADLRGFIFGAGAFVRATALAQTTHRLGAFNGVAVGLSVAAAIVQTVLGGPRSPWRRGEAIRVGNAAAAGDMPAQYLLLASTLGRMPLGIAPFGRPRPGLKLLRIDAPARRILQILPGLLRGEEGARFAANGYHRCDATSIDLHLPDAFTLDGETFEGGELSLRQGWPIRFAVP